MRSIWYVQLIITTVLSLVTVKLLYRKRWTRSEKMIFSGVACLVFFFLIGAFWFSTEKKLDEIVYEAMLCPFFSLSRCELSLDEREGEEQARLGRERKEPARLEQARLEQARLERARLEREREERAKLEQARLERERKERAKLEREERARLAREREEAQRRSKRFAAMAVGNAGRRLFAVTARDMPSYADAEAKAMSRCNQEVSNCRIATTFSGAGKCGYAATAIVGVQPLFSQPDISAVVRTGPTATEAIERCKTVFRNCYIFHTSCNSP